MKYDREVRIAAANFLEHVQAVAVGQAEVQQQKVEGMLFELGEPGFRGFGAGYAVAFAFQQNLQAFSNLGFVVDDEDGALRHGRLSWPRGTPRGTKRSEEHTSELQSRLHLVCRLLLEKKKKNTPNNSHTMQQQH